MPESALLGRDRPLSILRGATDRLLGGHAGLVLVTGEPGIGKTALVAEAADEARRRGVLVASGTCWDGEGAPGYWPWVQVVRGLERASPEIWRTVRPIAGDGLAHLLGESTGAATADDAAFQLSDAITRLVTETARVQPVLVVLDDLHWADAASIRLLDFLVRHAALEPVLVLGTYRDSEIEAEGHPLRHLLLGLAGKGTPLALGELDLQATALLMARVAEQEPDRALAAEVHRRTGGNPFFVEQAAHLWTAGSSIRTISPTVREAVERRLARLSTPTFEALSTAALLGADFDIELLSAVVQPGGEGLQPRLDEAVAACLIAPLDGGRFRFVHDLVRETLGDMLDADEQRRRHAAIVYAIEGSALPVGAVLPAQLAHHAYLAVPHVEAAQAVRHLLAAARDATARMATDEACLHYWRGLELIPESAGTERLTVLLAFGAAQQRLGTLDDARLTFEAVLEAARQHDDAEVFARAVLGLHGLGDSLQGEAQSIELVDEARTRLAATQQSAAPLAARLLAAASRARTHRVGEDRLYAEELSAQAVALARKSGDDGAIGFCLLAHHDAIWKPGTAAKRVELADEMLVVARRSRDRELELQGSLLRMIALLEQGDPGGLDAYRSFVMKAERNRLPRFRYLAISRQGAVATLQGQFREARAHIDEALTLGEQIGEVDSTSVWGDQIWALGRLLGKYDETEALIARLRAAGDRHVLVLEVAIALDKGDPSLALRRMPELEMLGEQWPRWAALMWLTFRAQLAAASRDPRLLADARAAIAPFLDQWAVLAGAVVIYGPMVYWGALIDMAEQRWDQAVASFSAACAAAARLDARPWLVLARLGLAECLLERGVADERERVTDLLDDVERDANEIGMRKAVHHALEIRARMLTADPIGNNVCRFDGEVWTLGFAGSTVLVPDAKGLHDLAALLAQPGIGVSAARLLNSAARELVAASRQVGADPQLDMQARASYRQRLEELEEDIAGALDRHEDERARALDLEREALLRELRTASGLGGRARGLGDEAQKARKTVTARIRDTLRHLDRRHPQLAEHLRTTVSTGATCCYQPTGPMRWVT